MESLAILSPLDGDFLYKDDGYEKEGMLYIPVYVKAPDSYDLKVNGLSLNNIDGMLKADIPLTSYENKIILTEGAGKELQEITVYWAPDSYKTYRLSLDDNIWFLKDLTENADKYESVFDNKYMAIFKRLHDDFGTKVHFNLYYQDGDFNLSQMPVKYKDEWKANSDWLVFTFHALGNYPDKPYENTTYNEIYKHCEMVTDEIKRFAGAELLSPYTTVHWGAVNEEGCKALKDYGFKGLVGYFEFTDGKPVVSYYFDEKKTGHLNKRDIWRDNNFGLTFIKNDMVINCFDSEDVIPHLQKIVSDPHRSAFIELMIHEQYFHSHYSAYQPDYEEKIYNSVKFIAEKGYKPVFLKEVLK